MMRRCCRQWRMDRFAEGAAVAGEEAGGAWNKKIRTFSLLGECHVGVLSQSAESLLIGETCGRKEGVEIPYGEN